MADSTSWYETPTGILVPIPPIAGAGGDVGAPAAPAAPAPAPSADSASAPTAPAAPTSDGGDLVDFMLKTFRSGPMRYRMEAAHWLTERGFGRAPQVVEHVGEEGGPIHVKVTWGRDAVTKPAAPPDIRRKAAGRGVNGRFPPGVSGNPAKRFQPGTSGNPTGRPKTFSIHQLVAEAIDDKDTRTEAVKRLQDNLKRAKTVVNTLEFAARVNREIGLGAETPSPR